MKPLTRMVRLASKLTDEEKEILTKLIAKEPAKKGRDYVNDYNHKGTIQELFNFYGHIS